MVNHPLISKLEDVAEQVSMEIPSISCWFTEILVLVPFNSTSSKWPTKNFTFSFRSKQQVSRLFDQRAMDALKMWRILQAFLVISGPAKRKTNFTDTCSFVSNRNVPGRWDSYVGAVSSIMSLDCLSLSLMILFVFKVEWTARIHEHVMELR